MCPYSSFIFISHCRSCQLHCLCQKAFGKRKCHENRCNYRSKPTPAGSVQPLQKLFLWLGPHVHIHISLFSHVSVFLLLFIKQKPPCSANLQETLDLCRNGMFAADWKQACCVNADFMARLHLGAVYSVQWDHTKQSSVSLWNCTDG